MLQWVVCVLCHAGGAFLCTIEKSYLQFEKIKMAMYNWKKIKSKKIKKEKLCTIPKVKTKKLQMKVFQFRT